MTLVSRVWENMKHSIGNMLSSLLGRRPARLHSSTNCVSNPYKVKDVESQFQHAILMFHKVITHCPHDYERVMVLYKALLKYWDKDVVLKYNIYAWMHYHHFDYAYAYTLNLVLPDGSIFRLDYFEIKRIVAANSKIHPTLSGD